MDIIGWNKMFRSDGFSSIDYQISIQGKKIEISANMKVKRAYYRRNIGSLNKGAKIKLLKVIVSYL